MIKQILRILLLTCSISAHAEVPSDSSLDELMQLTHQRQQIMSTYGAVLNAYATSMFTAAAQSPRLTEKQRRELVDVKNRATEVVSRLVTWEVVHPMLLELYRGKLSQVQVNQVLEMLKSPAWKTYSESVVPVLAEAVNGAVQIATRMYPQIEAEVSRAVSEALQLQHSQL